MDFLAGKQTLKYSIKIEYLAGCSSVTELFNWKSITLQLQDLISFSPLLSAIQFLWRQFGEFGNGTTNNPLINIFRFPIASRLDIV